MQVLGLAHVRNDQTTASPNTFRLKNRNEPLRRQMNYAREISFAQIARSAPIRENEREWKIAIQRARSIQPRVLH